MVASPNFIRQKGAQSATFEVPNLGTVTVLDWAALPAGKLKDLLNTQYGAYDTSVPPVFVPDFTAFFEAMGDAGFAATALHRYNDAAVAVDPVSMTLDANGYPVLSLVTAEPGPYLARVSVAYSASE